MLRGTPCRDMADIRDKVKNGLSEVRTLVLGAQILLGFQYEAAFEPGFAALTPRLKAVEATALGLLIVTVALLMAPASFHRLSERGDATRRQSAFTETMMALSLGPFALAIGINLAVVTRDVVGMAVAAGLGAAAVALALFFWFGLELMFRRSRPIFPEADVKLSLKERITEMLTETRIVLPGVQALLGFQLIAYLTEAFKTLSVLDRTVHTSALLLLVLAVILLMTPASFLRIADHGDHTERADRLGVACMLSAMIALALALGADAFVVLNIAGADDGMALAGGASASVGALGIWIGWPLFARGRR
jgi:hypothetical protein